MLVADVASVCHLVTEVARYSLSVEVAMVALQKFFFLLLAWNGTHDVCEMVVQLSRNNETSLSQRGELVAHALDEPEAQVNEVSFNLFHVAKLHVLSGVVLISCATRLRIAELRQRWLLVVALVTDVDAHFQVMLEHVHDFGLDEALDFIVYHGVAHDGVHVSSCTLQ